MSEDRWTKLNDEWLQNVIDSIMDDISIPNVLAWIRENLNPDEVFDEAELERWAEDYGFVYPTNNDYPEREI